MLRLPNRVCILFSQRTRVETFSRHTNRVIMIKQAETAAAGGMADVVTRRHSRKKKLS